MGKINDRYDYVVIGAGGAGMQLVYRLIIDGIFEDRTALIIDPDTKEKNDRTWCFWARDGDDIAEAYAPVISKSWSSCLVDGDVQSPYGRGMNAWTGTTRRSRQPSASRCSS